MKIFEDLQRRGLIAQVTDEPEIKELINNVMDKEENAVIYR